MNPAYGYINAEGEYKGYDLQDSSLFSDEDIATLLRIGTFGAEDLVIMPLTESQLVNDLPFEIQEYPSSDNIDLSGAGYTYEPVETEQFALLNPSYGYLNADMEYTGFDLEEAALYTDEAMERLKLDPNEFVKQPFTEKQLNELPFLDGLPPVQEEQDTTIQHNPANDDLVKNAVTPEFDFADFGKGLDDLDTGNEQTHE